MQMRWINAIAIVGTVVAGLLALAGALFALLAVDASGVGICTLGAALAFGLLANAVLRD
jgi:hypothetical protein